MKKFITLICCIGLMFALCQQAAALVKEKNKGLDRTLRVFLTSFLDYPPFGSINRSTHTIDTIFQPFVDTFNKASEVQTEYTANGSYDDLIYKVVSGKVDILLGAYYDTRRYDGVKLLYPAIANNPVVLVTMPYNTLNIKSKDDLKPLKGAIDKREHFADYVMKELQNYNIQEFDDSNKLYEQLFIGNVDFVLTSRYYGALEQAKLGIRDMVQMSKNALWDMPLFIGVSGVTRRGNLTENTVKSVLKNHHETLKQQIDEQIIDIIRKADEAAVGIVPPSYVK